LPDQANTELSVIIDELLRATRTEIRSDTIADGPGGTNEDTVPVLPCTAEYQSRCKPLLLDLDGYPTASQQSSSWRRWQSNMLNQPYNYNQQTCVRVKPGPLYVRAEVAHLFVTAGLRAEVRIIIRRAPRRAGLFHRNRWSSLRRAIPYPLRCLPRVVTAYVFPFREANVVVGLLQGRRGLGQATHTGPPLPLRLARVHSLDRAPPPHAPRRLILPLSRSANHRTRARTNRRTHTE
jgi:hypothetical protein